MRLIIFFLVEEEREENKFPAILARENYRTMFHREPGLTLKLHRVQLRIYGYLRSNTRCRCVTFVFERVSPHTIEARVAGTQPASWFSQHGEEGVARSDYQGHCLCFIRPTNAYAGRP